MSAREPTPSAAAAALPAGNADARARNRAVLQDLIDLGADLARRIHAAAAGPEPASEAAPSAPATVTAAAPGAAPKPAPLSLEAATVAFDRIARTVRRTIALANHLDSTDPGKAATPQRRAAARARVIRDVEDAIHRHHRVHSDVVAADLYAEFELRLTDPELDIDLGNRPLEEIIEELCRDLGLAAQGRSYIFKRRTPADIAALRARAASPALQLIEGGRPQPAPRT